MEKKRMKWADIERIYKAFIELKEALYKAQPYGIAMPAIELVEIDRVLVREKPASEKPAE